MKKLILMASAALAFGGAAMAQDATTPTGTTTPDAASQPAATPDMGAQPPAAPAPDASTPPAPDAGATPAGAPAPAGATTAPGTATGPSGPVSMTPTQGPADLPTCSKSVTDNCKQGAGKSGGHHKAARHHKK